MSTIFNLGGNLKAHCNTQEAWTIGVELRPLVQESPYLKGVMAPEWMEVWDASGWIDMSGGSLKDYIVLLDALEEIADRLEAVLDSWKWKAEWRPMMREHFGKLLEATRQRVRMTSIAD